MGRGKLTPESAARQKKLIAEALKELERRITACTNAEARVVESALSDFANRGYLKIETTEKGCTWLWA